MLAMLTFRFDAIVSADAFENLKPAPDIFLAAAKILGVPTSEVIVKTSCNIVSRWGFIERFSQTHTFYEIIHEIEKYRWLSICSH